MTTAGVVLLTVFVNGATTGWVMRRLGLTRRPASERLANLSAKAGALDRVRDKLEELGARSGLRAVDWSGPLGDIAKRKSALCAEIEKTENELSGASEHDRAIGYWNQALAVEREEYWAKFARGTVSPTALRSVLSELDRHQDRLASGDLTPLEPRTESAIRRSDSIGQRLLGRVSRLHFERLALIFDIARAEAVAAADVLRNLDRLGEADKEIVASVRATYERNLSRSKQRIEGGGGGKSAHRFARAGRRHRGQAGPPRSAQRRARRVQAPGLRGVAQ